MEYTFDTFLLLSNSGISVFLIWFGLCMKTKNLGSSMIFKFIPFMGGLCLAFNALKLGNII